MNEINCLLCCYAVVSKSDYDEVKAQLEKAKEALAFYAREENWPDDVPAYQDKHCGVYIGTDIHNDYGGTARKALNELQSM